MEEAGADTDEVMLIANTGYKSVAEELGIEFVEASTETFKKLFEEVFE